MPAREMPPRMSLESLGYSPTDQLNMMTIAHLRGDPIPQELTQQVYGRMNEIFAAHTNCFACQVACGAKEFTDAEGNNPLMKRIQFNETVKTIMGEEFQYGKTAEKQMGRLKEAVSYTQKTHAENAAVAPPVNGGTVDYIPSQEQSIPITQPATKEPPKQTEQKITPIPEPRQTKNAPVIHTKPIAETQPIASIPVKEKTVPAPTMNRGAEIQTPQKSESNHIKEKPQPSVPLTAEKQSAPVFVQKQEQKSKPTVQVSEAKPQHKPNKVQAEAVQKPQPEQKVTLKKEIKPTAPLKPVELPKQVRETSVVPKKKAVTGESKQPAKKSVETVQKKRKNVTPELKTPAPAKETPFKQKEGKKTEKKQEKKASIIMKTESRVSTPLKPEKKATKKEVVKKIVREKRTLFKYKEKPSIQQKEGKKMEKKEHIKNKESAELKTARKQKNSSETKRFVPKEKKIGVKQKEQAQEPQKIEKQKPRIKSARVFTYTDEQPSKEKQSATQIERRIRLKKSRSMESETYLEVTEEELLRNKLTPQYRPISVTLKPVAVAYLHLALADSRSFFISMN